MRAALSYAGDRVAPVFDVAGEILLVDTGPGAAVLSEKSEKLGEGLPVQKALKLAELGVEVLVCGAISRPLQETVAAYGIQVKPFITGKLKEVMRALVAGELEGESFTMPGCRGRGRGRVAGKSKNVQEVSNMSGQGSGGKGRGRSSGGGTGTGRGRGQGLGRMGGTNSAGTGGSCVCPRCGHSEPHQRGVPCYSRNCPSCGTLMVRE